MQQLFAHGVGEEHDTVFLTLNGTDIAALEAAPAMVAHTPVASEMPDIVAILMELPCKQPGLPDWAVLALLKVMVTVTVKAVFRVALGLVEGLLTVSVWKL